MTEAFEKWAGARFDQASRQQGWDKEAHFWLSAFVQEVERRWIEAEKDRPLLGLDTILRQVFVETKYEFGLDKNEDNKGDMDSDVTGMRGIIRDLGLDKEGSE